MLMMRNLMLSGYLRIAMVLYGLLAPALAYSGESFVDNKLRFSGFISQAIIYTDHNNFFGESEEQINWDYREIGALVTAAPTDNLYFSVQLLARKAGQNSDGSIKVDHAAVSYNFINNYETTLGVHAGRLKSPKGWYNETRDVPFTRPSIFLAQSIYFDRARNTYYFQDGVYLRGEHRFGLDSISWHAGYFQPNVDDDELVDVSPLPGTDDSFGNDSWSAGLVYDHDAGRLRLGLSLEERNIGVEFDDVITFPRIGIPGTDLIFEDVTVTDLLREMHLGNQQIILSFEYNIERWSFVGERSRTVVDIDMSSNPDHVFADQGSLSQSIDSRAYYLQTTYRASEKWDILLRYDVFYMDEGSKDGKDLAADPSFNFMLNPYYSYYAKDWTLGAGWHINQSWLVHFEWHSVRGTAWITAADNPNPDDTVKAWNLYAAQVSYRF